MTEKKLTPFEQLKARLGQLDASMNAEGADMRKSLGDFGDPSKAAAQAAGTQGNNAGDGGYDETDEEKAAAAAAKAAAAEAADADAKKKAEHSGETMAKSFIFADADGKETTGIDVTAQFADLVKDNSMLKSQYASFVSESDQAFNGLCGLIENQQAMIKSLTDTIEALGSHGAGRKSILTVTERFNEGNDPMAKSLNNGQQAQEQGQVMSASAIMAKAQNLFDEQKMTGVQMASLETKLNNGAPIPEELKGLLGLK